MKKLNKTIREKILYPWLLKNPVECTILLHETIVLQMHKAGIRFVHINKWLDLNNLPEIKAYTITPQGQIRIFWHTTPDAATRKTIKTPIYEIR